MSSNSNDRNGELFFIIIVAGLVVSLFLGIVLSNWAIWTMGIPLVIMAFMIYLFYRLVIAVEHIAYNS
ncbi:hypothetical protein [Halomontanus rarus]|uniref:hypothetical protein n=1 Tax=Halomontanus rarus TaxID=3034020 RepID=UPI0023E84848|nr:hypothetical protein [Halovivax sp. TS33]